MKPLIFGYGEFAKVLGHMTPFGAFTVHRRFATEPHLIPYEALTSSDLYIAIGPSEMNKHRQEVYEEAKSYHNLLSWVHPSAIVNGTLGHHSIVFELNNIQPFAEIGDNVVLWSGNHVGHHSVIGNHCFISSHTVVSGGVTIGERSFLGVNSTIRDHVVIGARCFIAPGSVVDRNMPDDSVWRGDQLLRVKSDQVKL